MTHSTMQTSGPQGHIQPFTTIRDPGAWLATDYRGTMEQLYVSLTPSDIDELHNALKIFRSSGVPRTHINQNVFPLSSLAKKLWDVEEEIRQGRGVVILRGVPLDLTDDEMDILTINLGISCYLGSIAPVKGSMTTQVRRAVADRPSTTSTTNTPYLLGSLRNTPAGYHTDIGGDILGLLCIKKAQHGGDSSICSVLAIHNELIRRGRLDILKTLTESNWSWDMANFHPNGAAAFSESNRDERFVRRPVLTYHDGYLSAIYTSSFRKGSSLTSEQDEALRVVEEIAQSEEFCLQFMLEPGDLSLMNNHTIIHARSQFEDTVEEPRHLLRTWVEFDSSKKRPLPDHVVAFREKAPVLRRPSVDLRSGSSKFLMA